jgi:hypothetical protein
MGAMLSIGNNVAQCVSQYTCTQDSAAGVHVAWQPDLYGPDESQQVCRVHHSCAACELSGSSQRLEQVTLLGPLVAFNRAHWVGLANMDALVCLIAENL